MSKFSFNYTHSYWRCWSHLLVLTAFVLTLCSLSPAAKTWLSVQSIVAMIVIATVLSISHGVRKMRMPLVTSKVSVSDSAWTEYRQGQPAAVFTLYKGGRLAPFGILLFLKGEDGVRYRRWILPGECDEKSYRRLARMVLNAGFK